MAKSTKSNVAAASTATATATAPANSNKVLRERHGISLAPAQASLAPTSAGGGYAPAPGAVSQTVGGDTNYFYNTGLSADEVQALIDSNAERKRRTAMATFAAREG